MDFLVPEGHSWDRHLYLDSGAADLDYSTANLDQADARFVAQQNFAISNQIFLDSALIQHADNHRLRNSLGLLAETDGAGARG